MSTDPEPLSGDNGEVGTDLPLELALARALACTLARSRDLAHALARNMDVVHELAFILNRARGLAHLLDPDLDPELALHLDAACGVAATLAYDRGFDTARAYVLARALDSTQVALDALSAALEHASAGAADVPDPSISNRPEASRAALRLTKLTVRCLPPRHRARYREEYAAELGDLAGMCWRAQWLYALNIATRVWILRRDLRRADGAAAVGWWSG